MTPAEVKARFSAANELTDSALLAVIAETQARIEGYMGAPVAEGDVTVTLRVPGLKRDLYLPRPRASAEETISVHRLAQDAADDEAFEAEDFDYRAPPPRLRQKSGSWRRGEYLVVYRAGGAAVAGVHFRMIALRLVSEGLVKVKDADYEEWRVEDPGAMEAGLLAELPADPFVF